MSFVVLVAAADLVVSTKAASIRASMIRSQALVGKPEGRQAAAVATMATEAFANVQNRQDAAAQ